MHIFALNIQRTVMKKTINNVISKEISCAGHAGTIRRYKTLLQHLDDVINKENNKETTSVISDAANLVSYIILEIKERIITT